MDELMPIKKVLIFLEDGTQRIYDGKGRARIINTVVKGDPSPKNDKNVKMVTLTMDITP